MSAMNPARHFTTAFKWRFERAGGRMTAFARFFLPIAALLAASWIASGQLADSPRNKLPHYELKMDARKLRDLDRNPYSDQTHPATFLAGGKEYAAKVRPRGAWARSWPKKALKIFFEDGKEFDGNHCLNLNSAWRDAAFVREPLAFQIYAACGVPASTARMVRLDVNGQFYGLYVEVEQPDKPFLKRHNLKGAAIYKANSHEGRADERDLGSEQSYAPHYEKETRKSEGHAGLQQFCRALAATKTPTLEFFTNHVDVPEYINYLAASVLVQNWDWFNKNHFLVHDDRGSGKWLVVPWDLDRTFGDHWHGDFDRADVPLLLGTRALPGPTGWNRMAERFFSDATLRARFLDRLDELLQKEFTKARLFPILDQLESQIAAEAARDRKRWSGAGDLHDGIVEVKGYILRRRDFLLREIARLRRK